MVDSSNDSEFVASLGLSETLQAILVQTAREFEKTGDWVTFDTLAYEAAEQGAPFDLTEVYKLPSFLGGTSSLYEEGPSVRPQTAVRIGRPPWCIRFAAGGTPDRPPPVPNGWAQAEGDLGSRPPRIGCTKGVYQYEPLFGV